MVGQRSLTVGTASTKNPAVYSLATQIANMHIASMEDLPSPGKVEKNGD